MSAACEAGVRRFVAQSNAPYRYVREGGPVKTEDDPLDSNPPASSQQTFAAPTHTYQTGTPTGRVPRELRACENPTTRTDTSGAERVPRSSVLGAHRRLILVGTLIAGTPAGLGLILTGSQFVR